MQVRFLPPMKIRCTQIIQKHKMQSFPLHFICVHLIFICGKNSSLEAP